MRCNQLLFVTLLVGACGNDGELGEPSLLPDNYKTTFTEVRDCRLSIDHDLNYIRILAAPDALAVYNDRQGEFPTGAVIVKELFGEDDDICAGPPTEFAVMAKLAVSEEPGDLGWRWQKVDKNNRLDPDADIERCTSCHADCGVAPDGYDGTCALP